MAFTIEKAKRKAVPMLISIAGVSGSGKTFSALLLAAGLAGNGRVGFLDTENGRGSMYADSPNIMKALPNGYDIAEMKSPFSPDRYIEAVTAFEQSGCKVLVIDSMTHEFEGFGGCCDIAENNPLGGTPNWARAKMMHKKMMNHLFASNMHIIFCLRARDKVKIIKNANGKQQIVPIGLQAIQEKNFVFEMILSMLLDEHTHLPQITKCPEPLLHLFHGKQSLITPATGEALRLWAESGSKATFNPESIKQQAIDYAAQGVLAYKEFWLCLTGEQQNIIGISEHEKNKELARMADDRKKAEDKPALPEIQF